MRSAEDSSFLPKSALNPATARAYSDSFRLSVAPMMGWTEGRVIS
jgi:hypothetical protein